MNLPRPSRSPTRAYRMVARAESAERTRTRIIDAATALFMIRDLPEVTLEAVAERAGVTLQTVLRRFGSKDRLFAAAAAQKTAEVLRQRAPERPGDARSAVRALVASYEDMGDRNWRLLRYESQHPAIHDVLAGARRMHRTWIEQAFAHLLPRRGAARARRIDLFFTATDFYVWKLHRLDLGRGRAETETLMLRLVDALARRFAEDAP